jgi:hypothetical protein
MNTLQSDVNGLATWGEIIFVCVVSSPRGEVITLSTNFAVTRSREEATYVALSQVEHGGFATAFDWE